MVMHQMNELQRRCAMLEAHNGEYEEMLRGQGKELKARQNFVRSLAKDFQEAEQRIQSYREAQQPGRDAGWSPSRLGGGDFGSSYTEVSLARVTPRC